MFILVCQFASMSDDAHLMQSAHVVRELKQYDHNQTKQNEIKPTTGIVE